RVIVAKFRSIANPPDVIPATGFAFVRPSYWQADGAFSGYDGLNDRAIRESSAAYVINRTAARIEKKLPKGGNEIAGMEIVANLLALVADHRIGQFSDGTFDKIGQKAVELCSRVCGTGKATTTETRSMQPEISPIFLNQQVGRKLGNAEQAMERLVNTHCFID